MEICPCCKRKMPQPKTDAAGKALREDLERVAYNVRCLRAALNWPNEHESFYVAVHREIGRMLKAQTDHRLLWNIFRSHKTKPGASYVAMNEKTVAA